MNYKYTVDIIINISHFITKSDFHGTNEYKIVDDAKYYDKYVSSRVFANDYPQDLIESEFRKEAQIASLALVKNEKNPLYGCSYFTVDWKSLKVEPVAEAANININDDILYIEEHIGIRDYLAMKIVRDINLKEIDEFINNEEKYNFDVETFYYGLMSNNAKVKYFNFFIIIERIEKSEEYKQMFNELLFSDEEKNDISAFIERYEKRKKGFFSTNIK